MKRLSRWRSPALALLLLVTGIGIGVGVSSFATAATTPGVIHLCVSAWTGQLRIVTDTSKCTDGYILDVNQQGVPGPQGPQGPAGPPGPQGSPGVSGLGNVNIATASSTLDANSGGSILVSCQGGEVATGGGFQKPLGVEVTFSGPSTEIGSSIPTIWWVQAQNKTSSSVSVEAWVVCATG